MPTGVVQDIFPPVPVEVPADEKITVPSAILGSNSAGVNFGKVTIREGTMTPSVLITLQVAKTGQDKREQQDAEARSKREHIHVLTGRELVREWLAKILLKISPHICRKLLEKNVKHPKT
ncbi:MULTISPECIES: hypothetical protein [Pseudomonas aeruginosa group]|uniref:hypothetical protein n=1 Tax=Pseudomonas aeruginosa group TaxID=136841 RepID=UPI001596CE07|nr:MULTISPECIES: hypothetical protein [Pseudomonas aeruginosa group]MDT1024219.1 hypothetical protein [Pseudomonas paraeruginosa]QQV51164.1 hypothetical protein JHW37_12825 [Pseudomonas aeruginosa]